MVKGYEDCEHRCCSSLIKSRSHRVRVPEKIKKKTKLNCKFIHKPVAGVAHRRTRRHLSGDIGNNEIILTGFDY